MSLILDGTNGLSDVDGSAATPAIRGSDANTGVFFGTDIVGVSTGGSERVRVDASGNVGIGTSSPGGRLDVSGSVANDLTTFSTADAATTVLNNANGVATGRATKVLFRNSGLNLAGIAGVYTGFNGAGDLAGALAFGTQTNVAGGVVERMRITSAGNVGIGTSSPGALLDVNGGIVSRAHGGEGGQITFNNPDNASAGLNVDVASADTGRIFQGRNNSVLQIGQLVGTGGIVTLYTAAAERARIDSSGNLLVGTTTASGKIATFVGPGQVGYYTNKSSAGGGLDHAQYYTDGGLQGKITQTGGFTTVSDYRLKSDVVSLSGMLGKVCKLNPVSYTLAAFNQQQFGFIAHELQEELPVFVDGEKDAVNEDGSVAPQSVDYPKMVVVLTAAIQELKGINDAQAQIITALTARVEALEGAQA